MTTIRRKRRTARGLTVDKAAELLSGEIFYAVIGYSGYGDGESRRVTDYISEEMRNDWLNNRTMLLEFWRSGRMLSEIFTDYCPPWLAADHGSPDTLPWASRVFDRDDEPEPKRRQPRKEHPSEPEQPQPLT